MRRFRVVSPKCSAKSSDVKIILSPMTHGPPAICLLSSSKSLTIRSKPRSRHQWTRYGYSNALRTRERSTSATGRDKFFLPQKRRAPSETRASLRGQGKFSRRPPRWPRPPRGGACRSGFAIRRGTPGFHGRFLAARTLNGRRRQLPIQAVRGQARTPMLSYCAGAASACRGNGPPLETALAAVRNRFF